MGNFESPAIVLDVKTAHINVSGFICVFNKTEYFRLWQYDEVWFLSESLLSAFEYLINAYMDSNEEVLEEYQKQWDSMSLF